MDVTQQQSSAGEWKITNRITGEGGNGEVTGRDEMERR